MLALFALARARSRSGSAHSAFKVYPLADGLFEKIYLLTRGQESYFFIASCRDRYILSLSITPDRYFEDAPRFDVYGNMQAKPKNSGNSTVPFSLCEVVVTVTSGSFIEVKRPQEKTSLFAIEKLITSQGHQKVIVKDQSIKWGLGERFQNHFEVRDGHWTIWNRDRPWKIDEGSKAESCQTYGHQPVYLAKEHYLFLYHLVYFKNTFGMMVEAEGDS